MRILNVDYMGCLYWHYHAKNSNPTWELMKKLRDIIEQFRIDKTLLLLEGGSKYRASLMPGYKSDRKLRKEAMTDAEKQAHKIFMDAATRFARHTAPLFGLVPVQVYGAEADDLAGYLCQHVDLTKHQILNLSGDEDWYQLLRRGVVQGSYAKIQKLGPNLVQTVWLSESGFIKEFGIPVNQWIWKKCLAGDTGDSVPGFPQVGEGTALKLLQKYGSIEGIARHVEELDVPRMRKEAKEAMLADFQLVHRNYQVMNLAHSPAEELAIFGEDGIAYLDSVIERLPEPNQVQAEELVELSYERGWLEVDEGWLRPLGGL